MTIIIILYFNRIRVLIGWLLPGMNSYSLFEMQKKSYPLSGDDVHLISLLRQSSVSHIPSWAIKHISYPLLGNQVYLISLFRFSYPKYRINTLLDSGFMNMKIPDSRISYHIRPSGLMWYEILSSGIYHIHSAFVQ